MKRDFFEWLMRYSPDSIYIKDGKGRFLAVSRVKAKRCGLDDPRQMIGRTDFDFMSHAEAMRARAEEDEILKTEIPVIDRSEQLMKNGVPIFNSVSKYKGTDNQENNIIIGISRDITKRVETEKLVKNVFVSGMHEVKNKAVGIEGLLKRSVKLIEKGRTHDAIDLLMSIQAEVSEISEMAKDANHSAAFLGFDQVEDKPADQEFDLRKDVFDKVLSRHSERIKDSNIIIDDFMGLIPYGITLNTVFAWVIYTVNILIDNAITYGGRGCVISYGYLIDENAGSITINVCNSGPPIDPEFAHKKLFRKFQREFADSNKTGTGIGLYSAREYIRMLGGELWYEPTEEDCRPNFLFTLPYHNHAV